MTTIPRCHKAFFFFNKHGKTKEKMFCKNTLNVTLLNPLTSYDTKNYKNRFVSLLAPYKELKDCFGSTNELATIRKRHDVTSQTRMGI